MNTEDRTLDDPLDRDARFRGLLAVAVLPELPLEILVDGAWMPVSVISVSNRMRGDVLEPGTTEVWASVGRNGSSRTLRFRGDNTPPWRVAQRVGEYTAQGTR